jgi:hypothetical protein
MTSKDRKLAPNALCSQLVKTMVLATADGNNKVMNECVHVLSTHFPSGTLLGDVVRARTALEKAFEGKVSSDKAGRILERARVSTARFTRNSLVRAFEAACSDCASIQTLSFDAIQPNIYDQLLDAWVSDDIVRSVELEDDLFETLKAQSATEAPEAEELNEDVDSNLLPLVIEKAGELLERMANENFGDDPRQVELLRVWSNAIDSETFKNKALVYVKEANANLAKIASLNEGTRRELANESKRICEELLYGERSWGETETLKALMLVLESERVLRKTLPEGYL